MEYLDEKELKEIIKEEIVRKVAAQQLDEQVFQKFMNWIKGKLPTVNQDKIEQAIDDHVEGVDDANIDQFVKQINTDIKDLLDKDLENFIYNVINKAVTYNFNKMKGEEKNE